MSKPIAVLISDVHYDISTLSVSDAAMELAIDHANALGVPLLVCGDLHNTKANLRAECITAMIETLSWAVYRPYVLIGNHDLINEKSEANALSFLGSHVNLVTVPGLAPHFDWRAAGIHLIPYQTDPNKVKEYLKTIPKGSIIIMHQGVQGTLAGDYVIDKSALTKQDLAGFRVISGHYHARQSYNLPEDGWFDQVGNPYTLGFSEANDLPKGYQVLYDNGDLDFIPTNLRQHQIVEWNLSNPPPNCSTSNTILWLKVIGPSDELAKWDKARIAEACLIPGTFRLDTLPTDALVTNLTQDVTKNQHEILDDIIGAITGIDAKRKERLKTLWKDLL